METPILFKIMGAAVSVSSLLIVGYWLVTGQTHANLAGVITIVAFNLTLNLGLPRLLPRAQWVKGLREGSHFIMMGLTRAIVTMVLCAIYLIGVGGVWLTSRILGKRFLETNMKKSNWSTHVTTENSEMF